MAEVTVIKRAVDFAFKSYGNKEITIIMDSLSTVLSTVNLNEERLIFDEIRQQIRTHGYSNVELSCR